MTLNDDYEGGQFIFPYYDITVKLKKGSVLIFPPFWTHEHSTNELENNTFRYTITTWNCDRIL
jgi:predicted 2-oxoglutarate/Fe(II)-dependent dioxygenase YbiX